MDPVNALFFKPGLRVENLKTAPLRCHVDGESTSFAYRWRHNLRPLDPAMSHNNNNNNNNGGLHACVGAAEDIEPFWVTMAKYSASSYATSSSSCCVRFLLLLSVCIQRSSFMRMLFFSVLVNFKCHLQAGIRTEVCWVVYNGSAWTQIFLKRCRGRRRKKIVLVRVDMVSITVSPFQVSRALNQTLAGRNYTFTLRNKSQMLVGLSWISDRRKKRRRF